jgi:hypothetical protein
VGILTDVVAQIMRESDGAKGVSDNHIVWDGSRAVARAVNNVLPIRSKATTIDLLIVLKTGHAKSREVILVA